MAVFKSNKTAYTFERMVNTDLQLLVKYPLISCRIHNGGKLYTGKVLCGNCDIDLEILEANNAGNICFKLKPTFGIPEVAKVVNANASYSNVKDFIDVIASTLKGTNESTQKNPTHVYRKILQEYSELTSFYLTIKKCHISTELTKIILTTVDDSCRDHTLQISTDVNEIKDVYTPVNLNLPEKLVATFPTSFSNLIEVYGKFNAAIESLQTFFDVMDDLDNNCCIIDPDCQTRRDCYRRIWLDPSLSVMVIVDPLNAKGRPEIKFLGPECIVDGYNDKLSENLEEWDESAYLSQNLLNVLGLTTFPTRPNNSRVMLIDTGECSICFSLRLHEKLPEVICKNKCCGNCFHMECLYKWLTSVNSKRMFNQLHGQCPNCEKKITCPLPDTEFS